MTRLKSRVCSFIVTIAMLAFVLPTSAVSAQTSSAKTLSEALLKTSMATSMESNGKLSLKLKAEGLSKSQQQQLAGVSKILNNLEVVFEAKESGNKNGTKSKQYVKTTANVGGIPVSGEIWSDKNLTGKKPVIKAIVKSPQLFKLLLPAQYANKYMVLDSKNIKKVPKMGDKLSSIDCGKMMSGNKDLQKLILVIAQKYSSQLNLKYNSITNDGNVYKVKIDDATFKDVIRKVVNLTAKNKEVQNLIKNYMLTEMKNSGASSKEINSTKCQIEQMLTKLQSQAFLDVFNKQMDRLQDVKILGDKGIEINYTIDENGYIKSTKADIEVVADMANIKKVLGNTLTVANPTGTLTAMMHFESNNKNINQKVKITLPKLNSKNSFKLSKVINKLQPKPLKVPFEVIKSITLTKGKNNLKVNGKIVNRQNINNYISKSRLFNFSCM